MIESEFYRVEEFASRIEFYAKADGYVSQFNLSLKNSYKSWRTPEEIKFSR